MKSAVPENSPLTWRSELAAPDWLSIPDILKQLRVREIEVSERQLERWREAKLLPPGTQVIAQPGHGSAYRYPPGTVDLAVAIHRLQTEKNDFLWIGWELWWRGWPTPEDCWRPDILNSANEYDPVLRRIRQIMRREREAADNRVNTLPDRVAPIFRRKGITGSIVTSRIAGRVPLAQLPIVLRVVFESASGIDPKYDTGAEPADQQIFVKATDLAKTRINSQAEETEVDDKLAGQSLQFRQTIGRVLREIAEAMRTWALVDGANAPRAELEAARDDIRTIMEIVPAFYQATRWIYGEKAFGLRFMNWVATKSPKSLSRLYILIWVNMRRAGSNWLSSDEIRELQANVNYLSRLIDFLKILSVQSDDLAALLKPSNLKKVLSEQTPPNSFVISLNHALKGFPRFKATLEQLISENSATQSSEIRSG